MAPLTWRHHTLIQALLSRGPLMEEEFHEMFMGISGKNPVNNKQLFNDVLLKINKELAYVQFELRACRNQYDGKVYYGVINNVADEQSKLGTKYSVPQIAFYKGVIEAIIQDAGTEGCVTNIEALNIRLENQVPAGQSSQDSQSRIPPAFRNFTMSQKEKTLNDLIRDRWLSYTSSGKIGLGVRSFLDLRSWFRSNDVPSCNVCNEAGVKASTCPNEGCNIRIHDYCLKQKFSRRKGSRACPGCGAEWPQLECEEEENDANEPEEDLAASPNPTTRRRLRSSVKAEAVEGSKSQGGASTSLSKKRLRSCKNEAVENATQDTSSVCPSQPLRSSNRRKR
uniref:Non-structural maintenance of chromosomes element 1 homolog n=1 Tax=Ananas comosus var. bracteatus TaxID=296719 RepID=A0A6V7NFQ8_ANACO|nr:unnamed protein product [Ananas comosus var. bracteatus]